MQSHPDTSAMTTDHNSHRHIHHQHSTPSSLHCLVRVANICNLNPRNCDKERKPQSQMTDDTITHTAP